MTMYGSAAPARFEIGRVVSRMFNVIGGNAPTFLALAALLTLPTIIFTFFGALASAFGTHVAPPTTSPPLAALFGGLIVGSIIYLLFASLLQAALTHGTIVALNGGKASFADCFATGMRHALPLTGIILLALLGMWAGFILLIVPGVILGLMWTVLTPVRVAERTGIMETFGRSRALTSGYKGSIFGLMVIYFVLAVVVELAIRPLTGLTLVATRTTTVPISFIVLSALIQIVLALISATGVASIYYELRTIKEGIGPEQLAAVFA